MEIYAKHLITKKKRLFKSKKKLQVLFVDTMEHKGTIYLYQDYESYTIDNLLHLLNYERITKKEYFKEVMKK